MYRNPNPLQLLSYQGGDFWKKFETTQKLPAKDVHTTQTKVKSIN